MANLPPARSGAGRTSALRTVSCAARFDAEFDRLLAQAPGVGVLAQPAPARRQFAIEAVLEDHLLGCRGQLQQETARDQSQ